ncbi:type I secretion system permease/ATPase [Shimia sp. R9_3]|uniref:type I secretion system permease/ATPase n=1 Tax=Shimia sp. R9_3 TaxID=2821113 RepID=UPI001ADA8C4F
MADPDLSTPSSELRSALDVVAWLARYHGRPFVKTGVTGRLPEGFETDGALGLIRALDVVGLKAKKVKRSLSQLDRGSLPAVLMTKSAAPKILVGLDDKTRTASIVDPATNESDEVPTRSLSRQLTGEVLLVASKEASTSSRLSPDAQKIAPNGGHWLWSELARHKSAWLQVFLAAFGVNLAGLALPIFVMNVFDRVIPNLAFVTLITLAIGVGLALGLDLLLRLLRSAIIQRVSRRADLALASRLFQMALAQKILARKGGATGAITNLRDFEVVRDFFTSSTLIALIDLAFVGIFLTVLTMIVGPLAWIPIAAIPVMIAIAVLAQVPIARSARQAQQMTVKRNEVLIEALTGLETVKSVGAEPVLLREWENAVAASSRVTAQTRNWANFTGSATVLVQQAVSAGIICLGVFLVSKGTVTIGALIAANIMAGRILAPLAGITQTIFRANFAIWSMRSISRFVETEIEQREALRSDLQVREGKIELREIKFTYPDMQTPAIVGISAVFEPGSTTALLGRIGSGKSTLGKLINGLYQPQEGTLLIDGHEIAQFEPAAVRAGVGYLPQDPLLFTGTIRENITLGVPDATDAEIMRVLHLAGLDAFVAGLPEGLEYFAGERGERLSGGQRQALSLARLLLRRPKFIFLDEPTNAMDHQSEALAIERLRLLQKEGVGMILSTHRMSLAALADRFIVIEQGRKVLDGPRAEVMHQLSQTTPAERQIDQKAAE